MVEPGSSSELRNPWLVATWPGMGAVAQLAGSSLVHGLQARTAVEVPTEQHFESASVSVRHGLLQLVQRPRTLFALWRDPSARRDLIILLAEHQPSVALRGYCEEVLLAARELRVERVLTFAAIATTLPPDAPARVFTAATDATVLSELRASGAEALARGEIDGMNGLFVAVAAEHGIPGACLLGEIPYFAAGVINAKAAAAVLRVFMRLSGLKFDFTELDRQALESERQLMALAEHLEEQLHAARESEPLRQLEPSEPTEPAREAELTAADVTRIEELFGSAARDRAQAIALKSELDRLGVFARYEDRFLDLFKSAQ